MNLQGGPMIYTSTENIKIKEYKKLQKRKYRDELGLFLVEGEHLVTEAIKSGLLVELLLEENVLNPFEIEASIVTPKVMKYLSELDTPSKMIGVCKKMSATEEYGNRLLLLDKIQDPGNLGSIIRSALAFHIDTIILGDDCVDMLNSKVIRGSQGMLFHLNIVSENLISVIPKLKKEGYQVMSTRVTHGKSLKTIEKSEKFAIIMGNEGNGVTEAIMNLCDTYIYIDMNQACESLNVSVAASIILYELDK